MSPNGTTANLRRSGAHGRPGPPTEIASHTFPGEATSVSLVQTSGRARYVVLAGCSLQVWDADTGAVLWRASSYSVTRVIGVLGRGDGQQALVCLDESTAALVSLETGDISWTWSSDPIGDLSNPSASVLTERGTGWDWYVVPTYSTTLTCWRYDARGQASRSWTLELEDLIDPGFGPHVIVADVLGLRRSQVILSARRGSVYRSDDIEGRPTSAQLVLGRADGKIRQIVVDPEDGAILADTSFDGNPGGEYPAARPYGLLTTYAIAGSDARGLLLAASQVEEYVVASRVEQHAPLKWSLFYEKNWPTDEIEFRPQVSSIGRMTRRPGDSFAFAEWADQRWRTRVVSAEHGPGVSDLVLDDCYFWGACDLVGSDRLLLVTSPALAGDRESYRRTASTIELRDAESGAVLYRIEGYQPHCSSALALPAGHGFFAKHEDLAVVEHGGAKWLLIRDRRTESLALWNPGQTPSAIPLRTRGARVVHQTRPLIVSDQDGMVHRLLDDGGWSTIGPVHGRNVEPLVWDRDGKGELIVQAAPTIVTGLSFEGTRLSRAWDVAGGPFALAYHRQRPTLLVAANGGTTLEQRIFGDGVWSAERVAEVDSGTIASLSTTADMSRVVLTTAQSRHVSTTQILDHDLSPVATLPMGSGPGIAGVGPVARGGPVIVAIDDHGVLQVFDRRGAPILEADWTAAYTTAMLLSSTDVGGPSVLRVGGIHGTERLALSGERQWRTLAPLWSLFPARTALVRIRDEEHYTVTPRRDGAVHIQDIQTGTVTLVGGLGPFAPSRTVAAADVDGDGSDEFLLCRRDGVLVCVGAREGEWEIRWESRLPAPVHALSLAVVDETGVVSVVVSTIDGAVRVLQFTQ